MFQPGEDGMSHVLEETGTKTAMYFEAWNEIHCPCGWWVNRGDEGSASTIHSHHTDCEQAQFQREEVESGV